MQTTTKKLRLSEAITLGNSLMQKHGLLAEGWRFALNSRRSSLGMCFYWKKEIAVSRYNVIYNSEDVVRNTILHEIAHALAGKRNEYGHGPIWKQIAISIGCNGERCGSMYTPPKFVGVCPKCSDSFEANRRKIKGACTKCCKQYNAGMWHTDFQIVWTKNS